MSSDNHQEGRLVYNSIMRNREAPVKSDDHAQKKKVSFDTEALTTAVYRKNYSSKYSGRSHTRWGARVYAQDSPAWKQKLMQRKRQSKVSAHTARLQAWHIHKWYHGLSDDWEEAKHLFVYPASSKGVRPFILDSGTSMRLIVWEDLTPEEKLTVRECDPVTLTTANCRVTSEWVVEVYVKQFDLTLEFNILTKVPPIPSLGKLVTDHGLKYTWDKAVHARPFLGIPTGTKKKRGICDIHNNIPNVYTAVRNDVVAYTE